MKYSWGWEIGGCIYCIPKLISCKCVLWLIVSKTRDNRFPRSQERPWVERGYRHGTGSGLGKGGGTAQTLSVWRVEGIRVICSFTCSDHLP